MNTKKIFTTYLCALALSLPSRADGGSKISGRVADANGKPVMGVLVKVKGTKQQALTDANGMFHVEGSKGMRLDFVHPDFYHQEITYKGQAGNLLVQLSYRSLSSVGDTSRLAGVPMLSGTLPKDKQVETIGFVGGNQLYSSPTYNFLGAAQGRLAGLNINFAQGGTMPSNYSWNVRNARQALFLVDGIQRDFYTLDPDQIESIQVLKDGLSTVMLGQRSSSGVINVITRKGNTGTPRISFTANVGFQQALKQPDVLGTADYMTLANEAYTNDGLDAPFSSDLIAAYRNHTNDPYLQPDVDWYRQNLKKTTPLYRYNVNISGASKAFSYFVDMDWYRENGFLRTDDKNSYNTNAQTNRFNIRSNLGVQVTPLTYVQVNLMGRQERYNEPGGGMSGIYSGMLNTRSSQYPVYNPDGTYGNFEQGGNNGNLYGQVVDRGYKFTDYRNVAFDLTLNQNLDFITKGLYVEATGSYTSYTVYNTDHNKAFATYWYHTDATTGEPVYTQIGADGDQANGGSAGTKKRMTYMRAKLGYNHVFGKHHIDALAQVDLNQIQDYGDHSGYLQNYTNWSGRINYDYDKRYVVEGVITRGGYNWLAPGKRWSTYYGFGAAWNAHNEAFIKKLNVFSTLKLRGTFAETGMSTVNYAEYIPEYDNTSSQNFWTAPYNSKATFEKSLPSYLDPEKAKKLDVGIDLGFLNDRLTATFDYYHNKYTGVVATTEIQTALLGNTFPRTNCQEYSYKGYEASVTWQDHIHNFNYYITGNIGFHQTRFDYTPELPKAYPWMSQLGNPTGMQYGYVADGIFQSQQEVDNYPAFLENAIQSQIRPGDIRYKDLNGDGVINQYDKTNFGSKKAKGYYGLTLGGNWKGLDFSLFFQGTINRQTYLSGNFMTGSGSLGGDKYPVQMTAYILDRWTPENHSNTHTRLWYGSTLGANTNNNQTSTFWLYNSDYLRLKNVEIGYTLPSSITRKVGIPSVRVFVSGMNLLTFSELFDVRNDIDPESWGASYPLTRTFNFGISIKL